jgi:hypothetical protein
MKKFKTILKIAILCEIVAIPILAFILSHFGCKDIEHSGVCGLNGFGAVYMIYPLGLTILLYILVKVVEHFNAKSGTSNQQSSLFWVLISALLIIGLGFLFYFQSIT